MTFPDSLYKKIPNLKCKGLCQEACSFALVGDKEREHIKNKLGFDPWENAYTKTNVCPQLKEGKCAIYNDRPMICRLFGVVKKMSCPFGCTPSKWLKDRKAKQLLDETK